MKYSSFILSILISKCIWGNFDVTIVGEMRFAESLARYSITLIDMLKNNVKVNYIQSKPGSIINFQDIPKPIVAIAVDKDKTPGIIAILTDLLWDTLSCPSDHVPNSPIKIAYSMLESTGIPIKWVSILNSQFDAVIVPDPFLISVYKSCGVKIPIFVVPIGLYLDEFLSYKKPKQKRKQKFTFGISATFYPRKNLVLLIDAFAHEFKNNDNVRLKVHVRRGEWPTEKAVKEAIARTKNVELIKERFDKAQYLEFMSSLDCYVFISKGEGFSITPREALALSIPCILSENTAHLTICKNDFVRNVPCPIKEKAYYGVFGQYCGYQFNCKEQDIRKALRDVYMNYPLYKNKALKGKAWVSQYSYLKIKEQYLTLVKPKQVVLGAFNEIVGNTLVTTSQELLNKYEHYVLKTRRENNEILN